MTNPTGPEASALKTPRLVLARQTADHAEPMYALLTDPAIYEFENTPPVSVDALRERYRKLESGRSPDGAQLWLNWVVRVRGHGQLIGYVQATVLADARALIAYEFGSAWWGQGFAHESTACVIQELRSRYGVRAVGAVLKQANHRSRKLLARLGMRSAGPAEFPRGMAEADEAAMVLLL